MLRHGPLSCCATLNTNASRNRASSSDTEKDIRTGKSGNRNEYVNKKKQTRRDEERRDEAKRQRQKHSEKNARVRFVASDLRRGGGESIVVGGGVCKK